MLFRCWVPGFSPSRATGSWKSSRTIFLGFLTAEAHAGPVLDGGCTGAGR